MIRAVSTFIWRGHTVVRFDMWCTGGVAFAKVNNRREFVAFSQDEIDEFIRYGQEAFGAWRMAA